MSTASKASGASRSAGTQKHTPGPWHLNRAIRGRLYVEADGPVVICDMQLEACVPATRGITEADAQLIAAAPDLLDALLRAVTHVRSLWEATLQGDHALSSGQIISRRMAAMEALPELDAVLAKAMGKATGDAAGDAAVQS